MKFFRTDKVTGEREEIPFSVAQDKIMHNGWNFSDMIEACKREPSGKLILNSAFAYYELERESGLGEIEHVE